tara:strand:- start:1057 stop:1458 length:402 start_codon:yes stop_codon:yes gene_type:complete
MFKRKKILFVFFGYLYSIILIAEKEVNFQNISIQSDEVTIDEKDRRLAFKNNINIKIENYIIEGSYALLGQEDGKLEVSGNPTSIQSMNMNGEAEVLVIHPNKSVDLIGNAKLKKDGNLIISNFITYQINSNE